MSTVVVGLSGGVDSAVAAWLLREAGHDVRAATLELWSSDDERSCCSTAAVRRAQAVARQLGVAHDLVDEEAAFELLVVRPFEAAYAAGETPNPCVECNPWRLSRLAALADVAGAAWVATGHYARVVRRDRRAFVARGRDAAKDQSYMLWRVAGPTLERLLLPLGELSKGEVRARAVRAALAAAAAPESQEVCFAPRGYRAFLAARGARADGGEIVDGCGRVLGRHRGHWRFTVGQRRGLGLGAGEAMYVLAVDPGSGRVVVGPRDALTTTTVAVRDLVDYDLGAGEGLTVQLRYRTGAAGVARLRRLPAGRARVELSEPFDGAAPGQSAVFYRDGLVVGGGVVARAQAGGRDGCDTLARQSDRV